MRRRLDGPHVRHTPVLLAPSDCGDTTAVLDRRQVFFAERREHPQVETALKEDRFRYDDTPRNYRPRPR